MMENNQYDIPEQHTVRLVNDPMPGKITARWLVGLLLLLILCLFLPWTQTVNTSGKLTALRPQDRPQEIHTIISGRIEVWFVQEGQHVKKGDTIVELSEVKEKYLDTNLLARLQEQIRAKEGSRSSVGDKLTALTTQIRALQAAQEFSIQKTQNKLLQAHFKVTIDSSDAVAGRADYEIAQTQTRRADSLFTKGLIALTELERRKLKVQETNAKRISLENKLLVSRNELLNASIELTSLEADYLDKISKVESDLNSALSYRYETESEISKMHNEYSNTLRRNGFYVVTAPQDGFISQARVQGVGETVKEGDVIVTIVPDAPELAVELFVEAMDMPLLRVGQLVRLQFDGWPALVFSGWPGTSFGTFGGRVAVIDNIDTKGRYRILVVPDASDLTWPAQVRVGSGVTGWLLLNNVPVGYEMWRQINGFPPDYVSSIPAKDIEKKTNQ
jgi:multidrug resistance efflux pump